MILSDENMSGTWLMIYYGSTRGCHNDSKPDLLTFICVLAISQEPLLMNGESENRQYQI